MNIEISPDAAVRIAKLTGEAHERIAKFQTDLAESIGFERGATDAELKSLYAQEVEVWRNLAVTLKTMLGLGGRIALEDDRNFICHNEWITYGVNQSRDGSWSVNS